MTDQPITRAQLDALERAADKVFGRLGIDIEFTRHFLDRVNDERNRRQITIRELGELFVKEYKRWGREIASMPIDSQAVMKDLSSELNIPFVLKKDGEEKDLVAKTVMRKKNFRTPNPELPVESVNEANDSEIASKFEKRVNQNRSANHVKADTVSSTSFPGVYQIKANGSMWTYSENTNRAWPARGYEREMFKLGPDVKYVSATGRMNRPYLFAIIDGKVKQLSHEPLTIPDLHNFENDYGSADITVYNNDIHHYKYHQLNQKTESKSDDKPKWDVVSNDGKVLSTFDHKGLAHQHYHVQKGWAKVVPSKKAVKEDDDPCWDGYKQLGMKKKKGKSVPNCVPESETHGAKRGTQVKGRDATPAMTKPSRKGHQPHPMRGKLVGESVEDGSFVRMFAKEKRREGWSVYVSRMNHRATGDYRVEFERDGNEFEVIGQGNSWELFRGPNLSGRGEEFDGLDVAFQTAADQMNETMDRPPLDVETHTPAAIAQKHGVDLEMIEAQLKKGVEIEMEHTSDPFAAMEIALDHLNEMPDYYDKLATIEPHHYTDESVKSAWESYQVDEKIIDPREAILRKALKYLDKKIRTDPHRQSLGGHAFDVGREVNLSKLGIDHRDLAQLYRDWYGDKAIREGWIEESMYYLDEVVKPEERKKKRRE